jgi:two-component system sensor histidine kinase DegS
MKNRIEDGKKVARRVVLESVGLIMTNDRLRLHNLLQSVFKESDVVEYLFIQDHNDILAHTFEKGVPLGLLRLGEFSTQSNLDIIPIEDEKGRILYHLRVNVGKLSSSIFHMGLSEQKINAGIIPFRRAMFIAGCILIIIVPSLFAYSLSRIIARPINSLSYGSKRIGDGELDYRLDIHTGDELEQLANEFNRMASKLGVNYATLEQKVAERTESLQKEVTERKVALDELNRHQQMLEISEKKLKEFSRKILSIREEEKKNLARSLHDELGSMTVSLGSILSIAEEEIKDNNLKGAFDEIDRTKNVLKQSVEKLKKISIDLRPPDLDILGLPSALSQYFSNIKDQTKIKIDFNVNMDGNKINDETAIVLYRVNQEALTNILKHADARKVDVSLYSQGDNIKLTVRDNGRGFDVEDMLQKTNGFGIQGMKERIESLGGTFVIKSASDKGTEILTTIPNTQGV